MPDFDDIDETPAPAPAPAAAPPVTLPAGTRCTYLRSAGDDIALFEAANAAAKDAREPSVVRTQMAVDAVATEIDADTLRATIVALIDGALVTYADRQHDPEGAILGTWREA